MAWHSHVLRKCGRAERSTPGRARYAMYDTSFQTTSYGRRSRTSSVQRLVDQASRRPVPPVWCQNPKEPVRTDFENDLQRAYRSALRNYGTVTTPTVDPSFVAQVARKR